MPRRVSHKTRPITARSPAHKPRAPWPSSPVSGAATADPLPLAVMGAEEPNRPRARPAASATWAAVRPPRLWYSHRGCPGPEVTAKINLYR
jgi:hypothetical protein